MKFILLFIAFIVSLAINCSSKKIKSIKVRPVESTNILI